MQNCSYCLALLTVILFDFMADKQVEDWVVLSGLPVRNTVHTLFCYGFKNTQLNCSAHAEMCSRCIVLITYTCTESGTV